ncbi:MAG: DUF6514 family protein [Clostridiales bacterium]|nr:DUF6514 family protein [Clostridiales bacterium]
MMFPERQSKASVGVKWKYYAVPERLYSADFGKWFYSYGILAAQKTEGGWAFADMIHDAAPSFPDARRMAEMFTKYQLSPVHLKDAVEDMMP